MISATITAKNEQLVIAGLKTLDERVLQAAETGLARGLEFVVSAAKLNYLSGSPLRRITGRLQSGMTHSVTRTGDSVIGRVGNNVKYAAFHEFGFHGLMNVKAHSRVMQNVNAKGENIAVTPGKVISGVLQTRKQIARKQKGGFVSVQFVKAHNRSVNYAGRPFVRPALEAMTPQIKSEIIKDLEATKKN
jgi:phage gpG-like protein